VKFLLIASMLLLVLCVPALGADVDGKWTGTIAGPAGDTPVSFTFKADAEKLTGSTIGLDGAEVPIKEGKIDGKNITFKVIFDFGGMPFEINYKGVVSPTETKLTAEFFGMPFEMTVKKEEPKKEEPKK
jgi:hypothetical protein